MGLIVLLYLAKKWNYVENDPCAIMLNI